MECSPKGKDFYLLCDFADDKLTEQEIIQQAITAYRKQWNIKKVPRQMKQDFGWVSQDKLFHGKRLEKVAQIHLLQNQPGDPDLPETYIPF